MRVVSLAVLVSLSVGLCVASTVRSWPPAFSDYPNRTSLHGRAHEPDLASHPDARRFRTQLRRATGPPDFAGTLRHVEWSCGTDCQTHAFVDLANGRVGFGPTSELGCDFRPDSNLFVVNPADTDRVPAGVARPDWARPRFYLWEPSRRTFQEILEPPQQNEGDAASENPSGGETDDGPWLDREFVIITSTSDYADARRVAGEAAEALEVPLDLRGLAPDPEAGLTFTREQCEESALDYPCYAPRGRWEYGGTYISIEWSTAYPALRPSLFVVILADGEPGVERVRSGLSQARSRYPRAFSRISPVDFGCMH